MARVGPYRSFTQGTLFSCARAEAYASKSVYGLVITARCDTAHGKANIINYVPVVTIEDWIACDGCSIIARRALADSAAGMKAALKDGGLSPDILETIGVPEILAELEKDTSKNGLKVLDRFLKSKVSLAVAEDWLDGHSASTAIEFLSSHRKFYVTVVRELLSHSLSDFHYVESIEPDEDSAGYVALLREIRFIPANVAEAVSEGLEKDGLAAICPDTRSCDAIQLSFEGPEAYAMPLATIQSPDIEFVIQRITQLFGRVGVADIPRERAARLQKLVPEDRNI